MGTQRRSRVAATLWYFVLSISAGLLLGYIFMGMNVFLLQEEILRIDARENEHFGFDSSVIWTTAGSARAIFEVQQAHTIGKGVDNSIQNWVTGEKSRSLTEPAHKTIHTLCTTNGSPYQNYQMRIAYATYNIMKKMPGGENHVAFTRILHRTDRDKDVLAGEIDTFRADPLQPECDDWCEYPVSDRANAMIQFLKASHSNKNMIKGHWLYMIESDYVFMKPLEIPSTGGAESQAWGFPFSYIVPSKFPEQMRTLNPNINPDKIPGTGPAPLLMTVDLWEKVTPDWEVMTAKIESNDEIKKTLGWVREMYAFSLALSMNQIKVDLTLAPKNRFIVQLPIDTGLGKAHAFHYTQCTIFKTTSGEDAWGYDKRFFTSPEIALKVPEIDPIPPFKPGEYVFVEGNEVTKDHYDSIKAMVDQMNRGIRTLADLSSNT